METESNVSNELLSIKIDNFEKNLDALFKVIQNHDNLFVSTYSSDMQYVKELKKRNMITTVDKMFGTVCNTLI